MKHLIIFILLLFCSPAAHAGWFSKTPDPLPEYKEKITALENQLSARNQTVNHWQIATGSLGVGCVLLFVIGTALGAQTRQNHDGTRPMGFTPAPQPPASVNGSKPRILRQEDEDNVHQTLAA